MKRVLAVERMVLLFGGVFLWNTWIFGWLNHGIAGYTRMSISDLNVSGQPYAQFFSITEFLSGLFMLLGAGGLMISIRKGVFLLVALGAIALIGVLTVFDATHPTDCNPYHNPTCVADVAAGRVSKTEKEHGTESILTDYITVSLGLFLALWATVKKLTDEDIAAIELASLGVLALGLLVTRIIPTHDVVLGSLLQRTWNTLVSFEFVYVAWKVRHLSGTTV